MSSDTEPPETAPADLPGAKALNEALRAAFRERRFSALMLLDIDDFSALNRRGERGLGDKILATVSGHLATTSGECFRVAGDDFVVVLMGKPRLTPERLAQTAEKLRESTAEAVFTETGARISLSVGGLVHPGVEFGDDERMADLVTSTAEELVIRAKKVGKDRAIILPSSTRAGQAVLAVMVSFYRELARINHSVAQLRESESRVDSLTGLHNRKAFDDDVKRAFQVHQRTGRPFAVIVIDSDSLKAINDARGHDAGDRFLLDVTRVLRETVRASDLCSRWGGDEFGVVAENLSLRSARKLGERIRRIIGDRTDGTVSIGVFCGAPASEVEALKIADEALYEAKRLGKNRVVARSGVDQDGS